MYIIVVQTSLISVLYHYFPDQLQWIHSIYKHSMNTELQLYLDFVIRSLRSTMILFYCWTYCLNPQGHPKEAILRKPLNREILTYINHSGDGMICLFICPRFDKYANVWSEISVVQW